MRAAILVLSFLPFIYFAAKDTAFHLRGRKVSLTEHLLHAAIGVVLFIMFAHALKGNHWVVVAALVIFACAGGVDEYIFHRGIPAEESDLHAKEHLALLIFIVVSLGTDWLEKNHWNLSEALERFAQLQEVRCEFHNEGDLADFVPGSVSVLGIRDVMHHQHYRAVKFTERLLHVTLGMTLTIIIPHAYLGHYDVVVPGLMIFVAARAVDEFVFHRGLAPAEVELHAKTHFGFLIFAVGLLSVEWLQQQSISR